MCLGYQWRQDLSSSCAIRDRIKRARKAYFQFGSVYAFQGKLSPISCCSIVETCVIPILLYGVENWVMSPESIRMLECFQGEVAKRILQLPKWYSNTAASVALDWNSLHSVCTIRKLRFLLRVMANEVDDVQALCLVWECRELEERYKSKFTLQILNAKEPVDGLEIIRKAQMYINKKDQALLLNKISVPPQDRCVHRLEEAVGSHTISRPAVIKGMKNFVRVITYPDYSPNKCPLYDIPELDQVTLAAHLIIKHTRSDSSWCTLFDPLITMDPTFFNHVLCFLTFF